MFIFRKIILWNTVCLINALSGQCNIFLMIEAEEKWTIGGHKNMDLLVAELDLRGIVKLHLNQHQGFS